MFRAHVAESDGRLGLFAAAFDVDDDALAERRMLDIVAHAQRQQLRVSGLRGQALTSVDSGIDNALAMRFGGLAAVRIAGVTRARSVGASARV